MSLKKQYKFYQHDMSLSAAAATFIIPKFTFYFYSLYLWLEPKRARTTPAFQEASMTKQQRRPGNQNMPQGKFSQNEEAELGFYLKKCSKIPYGLTCNSVMSCLLNMSVSCVRNWDIDRNAGIDWMQSFVKRHPRLSNCKPENTSITRVSAFNRHNVNEFYNNYTEEQKKYIFSPESIFNIDETGTTTILQLPAVKQKHIPKQ